MKSKAAVYLCSGCGIGNCINLQAIAASVSKNDEYAIVSINSQLCADNSLEQIRKDIAENNPDTVIIAACSGRYMNAEFNLDKQTERVNFREQVCMCHEASNPDTQLLALDQINMALAKLNAIKKPIPFIPAEVSESIAVIGGGITGIQAAIEGAKAGYRIDLFEKNDVLGGWSNSLFKQVPYKAPYNGMQDVIVSEKIKELEKYYNISVYTASVINSIKGQPGEFSINFKHNEEVKDVKAGSVVLASGWKPYEAGKLTEYGYGIFEDVIANVQMEEMAKTGLFSKPSDGKVPESVLFIQCAGSRCAAHLPYCSNYCCNTTLKQALYLRNAIDQSKVFIVYKDMRANGRYESFYQTVQADEQVFMTKGTVSSVAKRENKLVVQLVDNLFNESIEIETDLVVLATGMTPNHSGILNLDYRLGNDLPSLKYDFPDSHFICFPYESRRTGIYAAGSVRAPMDIASSIEDAGGAMLKAIQCIEAVKRGEAVHPRSGDQSFPEINFQRCTDCKRCTEECPFGTYNENEKGTPIVNPTRCRRCGICMGACPERVISFEDFNVQAVSAIIKSVSMPDEFEEKPRILAFVCENDAYPAFDLAAQQKLKYSPFLRIIPVRCLGSVNKIWISDALSKGFDGILLIGCKPGDDYQCHFIHGSELTEKRGENIGEVLQKMMLEPERIKTVFMEISDYHKIPQIIDSYVEEINLIGMNPFKGM